MAQSVYPFLYNQKLFYKKQLNNWSPTLTISVTLSNIDDANTKTENINKSHSKSGRWRG